MTMKQGLKKQKRKSQKYYYWNAKYPHKKPRWGSKDDFLAYQRYVENLKKIEKEREHWFDRYKHIFDKFIADNNMSRIQKNKMSILTVEIKPKNDPWLNIDLSNPLSRFPSDAYFKTENLHLKNQCIDIDIREMGDVEIYLDTFKKLYNEIRGEQKEVDFIPNENKFRPMVTARLEYYARPTPEA